MIILRFTKMSPVLLGLLLAFLEQIIACDGLLYDYVTCGSVVKLEQSSRKVRLHSHEVQYGSGSGQQSVTGIEDVDDVNSHWTLKGATGEPCLRGVPIACGQRVRFEHLATGRNLHSHLFPAPLSRGQEVSAFGKDGVGDTGDHWTVVCDDRYWRRDGEIMLKHQDTNMYLALSGNTFGHPIPGQLEVYAVLHPDSLAYWTVNEGVFVKLTESLNDHKAHAHSEL